MKRIYFLFATLLVVGTMNAARATFYLQKATEIEGRKSYVFVVEENAKLTGVALTSEVVDGYLQTTADFKTQGLYGDENYVWTMFAAPTGFYLFSAEKWLNNKDGKVMSMDEEAVSIWSPVSHTEGVTWYNTSNSNRYIGEMKKGEWVACTSGGTNYPRDFIAYELIFGEPPTTGIDQITNNQSPMTNKVIRNGQLIIIKNGVEYNALGTQLNAK